MFQESSSHRPTEQLMSRLDARRVHENDPNSNESETSIPLLKWPCGAGLPRFRALSRKSFLQSKASREDSWDSPTRTSEATLMRRFSSVVGQPPWLPHRPNPSWCVQGELANSGYTEQGLTFMPWQTCPRHFLPFL